MSLNLEQKQAVVAEVSKVIADAQVAAVAEYRGLTVAQMTVLRQSARKADVYVRIIKNTLVRRAVQGSPFECMQDQLVGPLAFVASKDPVAVAKTLTEFAKSNEKLIVKVGAMGGKLLSAAEMKALAALPSRDQLLAMLMGTMQAPVQKFVATLNEVPARFVRTLAAVRDKQAESAAA